MESKGRKIGRVGLFASLSIHLLHGTASCELEEIQEGERPSPFFIEVQYATGSSKARFRSLTFKALLDLKISSIRFTFSSNGEKESGSICNPIDQCATTRKSRDAPTLQKRRLPRQLLPFLVDELSRVTFRDQIVGAGKIKVEE